MVHGFARQSGGDLEIDSRPGVGTEARLYLPLSASVANGAHRVAASQASTAPSVGRGERVLVVEDDLAVRAISVAFLRAGGYTVDAVADAETALQLLQDDAGIALLFTDVMLGPGMDGKQLARHARERRPGLRVLLTSGDEEHAADADATSDLRLLRKPWRREDLVDAVRAALVGRD
jgi:CheY-like chemotaxis protein